MNLCQSAFGSAKNSTWQIFTQTFLSCSGGCASPSLAALWVMMWAGLERYTFFLPARVKTCHKSITDIFIQGACSWWFYRQSLWNEAVKQAVVMRNNVRYVCTGTYFLRCFFYLVNHKPVTTEHLWFHCIDLRQDSNCTKTSCGQISMQLDFTGTEGEFSVRGAWCVEMWPS